MNSLQIFNNPEFGEIRTIQKDGEPWFVLKDVCNVLDLGSPHKVADRLENDEKGRTLIPTPGGQQEVLSINEYGLYKVIFRSDKPKAKPFTNWVTHEVLPSIRKTGAYIPDFQSAPLQAESASGVAQLIKALRATMKDNEQPSEAISQMVLMLCLQFGIRLPEDFVRVSPFEQLAIQAEPAAT